MGSLVPNKPSVTVPETPPPAPTVENSQSALDQAAREQSAKMQRGRAATILTGGAGLSNLGTTSQTLLGR